MLSSQEDKVIGNSSLISSYFSPRLVLFLDGLSREESLRSLVESASYEGFLSDKQLFYELLLQREKISSTGIGMGVALPHAKLPDEQDFFVAIGIHSRGVLWDAIDGVLVRLIFMIGGPENRQASYLRLLSELTLSVKDDVRRRKLLQARSPEEVIKLFLGE